VDATVSPLTDTETGWIAAQLRAAEQCLADYGSDRTAAGLDGYDHAWASWLDRQRVDPANPEPVINAVAIVFGQTLVDSASELNWVLATDPEGTTIAVHGQPGSADLLIYPSDVIFRRYETGTTFFLRAAHDEIVAEVARLRG
jgi:hypothetical protein